MPLSFDPGDRAFVLWGDDLERTHALDPARTARAKRTDVIVPAGRRVTVDALAIDAVAALAPLASMTAAEVRDAAPSIGAWSLASKLALDLVVRERIVPRIEGDEVRWAAALGAAEDEAHVRTLARALPPSAHAVAAGKSEVWTPDAVVRAYLDAVADALARRVSVATPAATRGAKWEARFVRAASGGDPRFETGAFEERTVIEELARWVEPALGARDRPRVCFRLDLPEAEGVDTFSIRFLLQSPEDPSLLVTADDLWAGKAKKLACLGEGFAKAEDALLGGLALAARRFPPIASALGEPRPEGVPLDAAGAWSFLSDAAPALSEAGFGVIVPGALTSRGQRRLRLQLRIDGGAPRTQVAGRVEGAASLALEQLVDFQWRAAIGDETLDARELRALARQKAPLVRFRGAWVAVDPRELAEIEKRLAAGGGRMKASDALRIALAGETDAGAVGIGASVVAAGAFAQRLERARMAQTAEVAIPAGLKATLRPYQARGLSWLVTMASLGLGGCLADDMGLGKTLQVIAFLLARRAHAPSLVVAPTSVLGNWEREIARFAPDLEVVRHYGPSRAKEPAALAAHKGAVILTSYGLLRRDTKALSGVEWSAVVLDEAQNIKNAASAGARAARSLSSGQRFALTGTPIENRLAELWSILEFGNPGLLGPLERFRTEIAVPVEKWGNHEAAEKLRRITAPFLLRRVKTDPNVIRDLPAKNEMKVVCTLTREQATLYQAAVDEEMRRIASSEGIERRGRVLALLTALKQICNHPAQYLGEAGPLPRRSGKLSRVAEMLEEALSAGDKALVFTQFREMGDRLVTYLGERLGVEVLFLHGGTPQRARDAMVRRFQEEPRRAPIFVLSVKAGGTGLNLTAANHVFHYDRWWNPAVEDQATDRAYRIGQRRAVQVHKLVCAGTVEEKVDALLEKKRDLASRVVGAGEGWITEMDDAALRDLVSLSRGAAAIADEEAPQ